MNEDFVRTLTKEELVELYSWFLPKDILSTLKKEQLEQLSSDEFCFGLTGEEEQLRYDLLNVHETLRFLSLTNEEKREALISLLNHDIARVRQFNNLINEREQQFIEEGLLEQQKQLNAKIATWWEYEHHQTSRVGYRLEEVVNEVLNGLHQREVIQDYEWLTKKYPRKKDQKNLPDFVINKDIALECKNWNPKRKTSLNPHTINSKIILKFGRGKGARQKWSKRIVVMPKKEFGYKEKECKEILKDEDIKIVDGFIWVSSYYGNKAQASVSLFQKFEDRFKEKN